MSERLKFETYVQINKVSEAISQATDIDLRYVIGRDIHLDQSHASDSGQPLCWYPPPLIFAIKAVVG